MNPLDHRNRSKRIALYKCIALFGLFWLILIIMIIVTHK